MRKLILAPALVPEFQGVEMIWHSNAQTRRVDALVLSWVKYEKQLRRLFSFLVFQHPKITKEQIDDVIAVFVSNRNLYPEKFISGIARLGVKSLPDLLGSEYERLWTEIKRIKTYRNKIMHGQITGQNITSTQLERDVAYIIDWITSLALAADCEFGYDGLRRNTYVAAKSSSRLVVQDYPFANAAKLKEWMEKL